MKKSYADVGGEKGDTVRVRGTQVRGVVRFFDGGLSGKWTVIELSCGDTLKVQTADLVLVKRGAAWKARK